jgi:hypothetical protein
MTGDITDVLIESITYSSQSSKPERGDIMYKMLLDTAEKQRHYKRWLKYNHNGTLRQYRKYLSIADS